MNTFDLHNADCIETLKTLPADSIDALITDPPAGISFMGKAWDNDKGGRKQWIAWMTEAMTECLRVMKPGAHGLVWAIPRTAHWTGGALEDAGFEVRDVITHLFGSGFPKSLDISKAIDKAAGVKREIVGVRNGGASKLMEHRPWNQSDDYTKKIPITKSSTDAAKQWAGWGTALKPAAEFWFLIRKPCSEKTVAANVLKYGCGALNIDSSRVKADTCSTDAGFAQTNSNESHVINQSFVAKNATDFQDAEGSTTQLDGLIKSGTLDSNIGTTPNKSIATSSNTEKCGNQCTAGCQRDTSCTIRTKTSKTIESKTLNSCSGQTISVCTQGNQTNTQKAAALPSTVSVGASAGRWPSNLVLSHSPNCTEDACDMFDCAAALLDAQSGVTKSRSNQRNNNPSLNLAMSGANSGHISHGHSDSGGASRFFYCAKTSTSERNVGMGELKNTHATVKSQKLMRYLCRLITPTEGVILDPFMGSGSTGVAAIAEGFKFVGIEKEKEYLDIAEKRISHAFALHF